MRILEEKCEVFTKNVKCFLVIIITVDKKLLIRAFIKNGIVKEIKMKKTKVQSTYCYVRERQICKKISNIEE